MLSYDLERLEDNIASFPLCAAIDKQFTFLLACSHVDSAIVQSPKACLTQRGKGGTH